MTLLASAIAYLERGSNPDFYTEPGGLIVPVRGTRGYEAEIGDVDAVYSATNKRRIRKLGGVEAVRERRGGTIQVSERYQARHPLGSYRMADLAPQFPKVARDLKKLERQRYPRGREIGLRRNPSLLERAIAYLHGSVRSNPELLCDHCGDSPEAERMSRIFHGVSTETAKVREANGRVKTVLDVGKLVGVQTDRKGDVEHILYRPDGHSARGGNVWDHRSGESWQPFGMGDSKKKPKLVRTRTPGPKHVVVDPSTKRPELTGPETLDLSHSPMRFNASWGLIK